MKKWNEKNKAEHLFILMLMFAIAFGTLCITGCGGNSCETIKCGSGEVYGGKATGISIPGCGGCITSGRGCDSCLWAQSCKFVSLSDTGEENSEGSFNGCDVRYYDGGCLGCGQQEKSCYAGCIKNSSDSASESMNGIIYGSSDGSENFIGCAGGCGGCVASDGVGAILIDEIEYVTGVE